MNGAEYAVIQVLQTVPDLDATFVFVISAAAEVLHAQLLSEYAGRSGISAASGPNAGIHPDTV